ncbi:MAG: hypothetical protein Tsb0016_10160 [Sphingomonadales bacterium]
MTSKTCFFYQPSYQRIAPGLAARGLDVTPLLMDTDGKLWRDGQQVGMAAAAPDLAWVSPDAFIDGHFDLFMTRLLDAPRLDWVQSGAAGYDHPLFAALMAKGVRLSNSDAPSVSIAEYVLAAVLDHFQNGPARRAAQRDKLWRPAPCREIAGTHWLIIGFGAIGARVARRARAFEARVTVVRRRAGADANADADRIIAPGQLAAHLPDADVVVLAAPLNDQTAGMVDAAFLARMKSGAVLVNVARGGLVDETALLAALDRDQPGHAVLDVFQQEPLPSDSPLWRHPKVALTAHLSGMGSGLSARSDALFLDNLARYLAGETPMNLV